jgi:antitoxin CptB
LVKIMALGDNDLLQMLLSRSEPEGELDSPEVHDVLRRLRAV